MGEKRVSGSARKGTHTTSRRGFLGTLAGAALAGGGALAGCTRHAVPFAARDRRRPLNVVIIFADDLGYDDVGCFWTPNESPGYEKIETPRLDRMAVEGARFTDFHVTAPVCTPSRFSLVTGCYPLRAGFTGHPRDVFFPNSTEGIHADEVTIAEILKTRGYATACVGKWHLGHLPPFLPTRHGFDRYFGIPYSNDMKPSPLMRDEEVIEEPAVQETLVERYTEESVRFVTENRDRPFFLYLPHNMPHVPLHISQRFQGKSKRGLYGDVIESLDWSTGEILDTLATLGLDETTLVIFTSDNGPWLAKGEHGGKAEPLRAGKGTTYEGGMRVPGIMRWPGKIPAGRVCPELATTMDFLPTVARLAGAEPPQDRVIDGKDIWPLMSGRPDAVSPYEAFFHYNSDRLDAVRSGRWKLVFERTTRQEYPYGWKARQKEGMKDEPVPEVLYDLEADVGETTNVIAEHPDVAERLWALAEKMREDLGDARTGQDGKGRRPLGKA